MNAKNHKESTEKVNRNSPNKEAENFSKKVDFTTQVGLKTARKLKARRNPTSGVWFGLGMMGVIGWSVVIPTLLGAALGIWLDNHYADQHSWTLALLIAGLTLGCFNAWYWVDKEQQTMRDEQEQEQEQEKKHNGE
jgi:ATP synthase protein I